MHESQEALVHHYRRMRAALLATVDGLNDERLSDRSLDGWAVKDHLAHIALWDDIRAGEVTRISAGYDSAWRMDGDQEAAFGPVAYQLRRDLSPAQARWELERSHEALLNALGAATERGLDGSLYGEAGLLSGHEAMHTGWIRRWREERGA